MQATQQMSKARQWVIGVIIIVVLIVVGLIWWGVSRKGAAPTAQPPTITPAVPLIPAAVLPTGPVKVGVILPLSGDAASYGTPVKNAIALAVEEINKAGGIAGQQVEPIYEDGQCKGDVAATAAQKLINVDKVKIILGGGCSGETLAFTPLAEQNKVIVFSSLSSSPDISKAGDYIFRNAPSDLEPAIQLAELVYKSHKRIGIISEQTDYAQAFRRVFSEKYNALGGEIVADELFKQGEKDFKTYLTKIKSKKPEAIFVDPQTGIAAGLIAKQAKELGVKAQLYGIYWTTDKDFFAAAKGAADGFIALDFVADTNNQKVADFMAKYRAKYNEDPTFPQYAVLGYDAPYIIKEAIEKAGYDTTKIKDFLYTIKNYNGIIGIYGFDQNGDVVGIKFKAFKIRGGKAEPLPE